MNYSKKILEKSTIHKMTKKPNDVADFILSGCL